jgi:hypothetical protein
VDLKFEKNIAITAICFEEVILNVPLSGKYLTKAIFCTNFKNRIFAGKYYISSENSGIGFGRR